MQVLFFLLTTVGVPAAAQKLPDSVLVSTTTPSRAAIKKRLASPFGRLTQFSPNSLPKTVEFRGSKGGRDSADPSVAVNSGSTRPVTATVWAASGMISDIGPYLRARSPLAESAALIGRPAFNSLAPAVREPLLSDQKARTVERDSMLPKADAIDDLANNRLGPWKERLDAELDRLNAETESYKSEVAVHKSKCAPARDEATWQWCLEDKKRLDEWRGTLVKRGDAHNDELAKFHAESKPYDVRLAALIAQIESWEKTVNNLIDRIKRAIRDTQSCTWTGRRYPPGDPNGLCVYNCTQTGETLIPPNETLDPPCPQLRLDVPIPPPPAGSRVP